MKRLERGISAAVVIGLLSSISARAQVVLTISPLTNSAGVASGVLTLSNTIPGKNYILEFSPTPNGQYYGFQFVMATNTTMQAPISFSDDLSAAFIRSRRVN